VAKVVICPSCQAKGSIPDESKAARIRCPKCGEMFDVKGASGGPASGTMKKPESSGAQRKAAAPKPAAYDDLDSVKPLPSLSSTGSRRSVPAAQPARGAQAAQSQGSPQSPMLFVAIGVGSVAILLLAGIFVVVMMRGDGGGGAPPVAQAQPAPPVEPVIPTTPASVAATTAAGTPAAAANAPVDHDETIRKLKDATVFIILKIDGKPIASGSGFVIDVLPFHPDPKKNAVVTIATNRHVAVADSAHLPPGILKEGSKASLDVVFRSGLGAQEQVVPAGIIAYDLTQEYATDLAFLQAEGVKNPPKPLEIRAKVNATEGMQYLGAGFPLGKGIDEITLNKGNPRVTITTGIVGRIHTDEYGQVTMLQVGGSLLPGNSGGPLIEEKTGKLLGVAVASLAVMGLDSVGFIVTADELRRALDGRVGEINLDMKAITADSADLEVEAQFMDPKRALRDVVLHFAPASAGSIRPNSDGSWPPLLNSNTLDLKSDPKTLTAKGRIKVTLKGEGAALRKVLIQPGYKDSSGKIVYAKPKEYELPEKPGRILPPGVLARHIKAQLKKSLAMLGGLVDPDKDCKLTKDAETTKIKIEIPGKIHTLSPEIRQRMDKKKSLHNAPFTVAEVEGDFLAGVMVTGDIEPGADLPKDKKGNEIPLTYQSGGIILYQDKDNFVRLERANSVIVATRQPLHWLVLEAVKDGKQAMQPIYVKYPERDTLLIIIRKKGKLICAFSPDEGHHIIPVHAFVLDLPKKVKLGLTAANISAKPLMVTFESFAVLTDSKTLDSLGEGGGEPKSESSE
jgi:S1-C subfamily serine protease